MLIQERIKFLFPYLGAAVAGTLLVCAYTPESYSWLAIAGLLLWFGLLARSGSRRESVLLGLIFGLFWFDLGLQWTVNSMTEHGHMPWLLSELGVFLLALLLSISPVLTALCTGLRAHNSLLELSLRWVSAFTFFEWFRGVGVMKFDWLNPAYPRLAYRRLGSISRGIRLTTCIPPGNCFSSFARVWCAERENRSVVSLGCANWDKLLVHEPSLVAKN
ncbi:MAG: hypothetical protein ACLTVB_01510 [Sutterella sp.]